MGVTLHNLHLSRLRLAALLDEERASFAYDWLTRTSGPVRSSAPTALLLDLQQAERFLALLAGALRAPAPPTRRLPQEQHAALYGAFPQVYTGHALLVLAELLGQRLSRDLANPPDALAVCGWLHEALVSFPVLAVGAISFTDRLARLTQFSWQIGGLRDQNAIILAALEQTPILVSADNSAIWLWDADQQEPVMHITAHGHAPVVALSQTLLHLMQQTCESGGVFSIDAGESDASWPIALRDRAIAFIPLPAPTGCLGILTVHHHLDGHFSHDDILLLSALGNLVATAIRMAQLHESERHLVSLLQSSVRQVVRATSRPLAQADEFLHSMLQVAEGLTRAEVVMVALALEEQQPPTIIFAGAHVTQQGEQLRNWALELYAQTLEGGVLADGVQPLPSPLVPPDISSKGYMAIVPIHLSERTAGILAAITLPPFSDDQLAFLHTVGEQIGIGIEHAKRVNSNERLLLELANINYVSQAVSSTFDPKEILTLISQASRQALNTPIVLCGWCREEGLLHVWPETVQGLSATVVADLGLTCNHVVVRRALDQHADVGRRMLGKRGEIAFPALRELGVKDWVCVPMVVRSRAKGIILVADYTLRNFTSREIALLSTYANHAALSLDNAGLYEQVEQQLHQINLLYRLTSAISSLSSVDDIYQVLLQVAAEGMQAPVVLVSSLEEATGEHRFVATRGLHAMELRGTAIEPGAGILGMVSKRGYPLSSSHLPGDGRDPLLREVAQREELVALLSVPMIAQGGVCGTLTVLTRDRREFAPIQEHLLTAIAAEAAEALENARRYASELQAIQTLANTIEQTQAQTASIFRFIEELMAVIRSSHAAEGLAAFQERFASISTIFASRQRENNAVVDLKMLVRHLIHRWQTETSREFVGSTVSGTRVELPLTTAAALAIFLYEWLVTSATRDTTRTPELVFQSTGQQLLVQISFASHHVPENRTLVEWTVQALAGILTEASENGRHVIRLRLTLPALSL
jgi:GAF domain-containing protein